MHALLSNFISHGIDGERKTGSPDELERDGGVVFIKGRNGESVTNDSPLLYSASVHFREPYVSIVRIVIVKKA